MPGGLTSIKVILLRDDLSPVLGTLSRQLLGLVQAADGEGLDVFLEGLVGHVLHGFLHGAEEGLHAAFQVVGRLLRLDDKAQALHPVCPPRPAKHDVTLQWKGEIHELTLTYTEMRFKGRKPVSLSKLRQTAWKCFVVSPSCSLVLRVLKQGSEMIWQNSSNSMLSWVVCMSVW